MCERMNSNSVHSEKEIVGNGSSLVTPTCQRFFDQDQEALALAGPRMTKKVNFRIRPRRPSGMAVIADASTLRSRTSTINSFAR